MEKKIFSVKEIVKESYKITEEKLWHIVGNFAIIIVAGMILSLLAEGNMLLGILVSTLTSLVSVFFCITYAYGNNFSFDSLLEKITFRHYIYYLIASILTSIITMLGLVLLVVPGIIAMTALVFTPYLIVSKNLSPIGAIKESMKMTKGIRVNIFLLMLIFIPINILGAIAFGIGLLFTIPMTIIAFILVYKKIISSQSVVV